MIEEVISSEESVDVETPPAEGVESSGGDTELQERMAGSIEESPWYSESEGAVVDNDGRVVKNPETGKAYKSIDEYNSRKPEENKEVVDKKPEEKPSDPMTKSFQELVSGGEELTADKFYEFGNSGDYNYEGQLVPDIDTKTPDFSTDQDIDPFKAIEEDRTIRTEYMLQPIEEIQDWLISELPNDVAAIRTKIGPYLDNAKKTIEEGYKAAIQEATKEDAKKPANELLNKANEKELIAASKANIDKLSRQHFPGGGTDAFWALVSGHKAVGEDGKETFVDGPAKPVLDLVVNIAAQGKKFGSKEALDKFYTETFKKITADEKVAAPFFHIAKGFWKGEKSADYYKDIYNKGKLEAQKDRDRVQKTIKTQPASYNQPEPAGDTDGMGRLLKSVFSQRE